MKKVYIFVALVVILIFAVGWRAYAPGSSNSSIFGNKSKSTKTTTKKISPSFNKNKHSISDPRSIWIVVNKQRPLKPIDYTPLDLTPVGNGQLMRKEAAAALANLIAAAAGQGLKITADSGYRSYAIQVSVYNNEVRQHGQAVADSESAKPGYSEHQTGFAVDVGGGGCNIEDCFANTKEGKWVAEHAYEYGFILRYTADKQSVTGYRYEPWHIRYVGTELSTEMNNDGITTLEEFFGL
ncbi:MAG TPA: M15 family metallopeptidase [Candidatus Saccharimonadales bacterium]|nr:M15 family metallopeptidase [Candidatus Saccharimonadales bacterium]